MSDHLDVAEIMSELARRFEGEESVDDTLKEMTASAVESVPGAEFAGVILAKDRRHIETRAATDPTVEQIGTAEIDTGEGPCLSALWDERIVEVPDLQREGRWPRWIRRLGESGVRSMLCFQLYVQDRHLAALNLYATKPIAFDDESQRIGGLFAAHAAVALSAAERGEQLTHAIDSRDMIGMAKGVLLERFKVTPDTAFQMLVRASQQNNIKLNEVAALVVRTGQTPNEATQPR